MPVPFVYPRSHDAAVFHLVAGCEKTGVSEVALAAIQQEVEIGAQSQTVPSKTKRMAAAAVPPACYESAGEQRTSAIYQSDIAVNDEKVRHVMTGILPNEIINGGSIFELSRTSGANWFIPSVHNRAREFSTGEVDSQQVGVHLWSGYRFVDSKCSHVADYHDECRQLYSVNLLLRGGPAYWCLPVFTAAYKDWTGQDFEGFYATSGPSQRVPFKYFLERGCAFTVLVQRAGECVVTGVGAAHAVHTIGPAWKVARNALDWNAISECALYPDLRFNWDEYTLNRSYENRNAWAAALSSDRLGYCLCAAAAERRRGCGQDVWAVIHSCLIRIALGMSVESKTADMYDADSVDRLSKFLKTI